MGMNVASLSGAEPLMDVNTTPLIDVMLVLLVMLILTIPMQLHTIPLSMGGAPTASLRVPVVHIVAIDFDGTVYWDGRMLAGAAEVDAKLREVGALAPADQPEVHIKPNRLTDYGAVAALMASVQRHGIGKMSVVGAGPFNG